MSFVSQLPSTIGRSLATWPGRLVAGGLVVALVGTAVVAPRLTEGTPRTELRTAAVARASVTQTVAVSGSVNASAQVRAAFKPTGRISEILVKVGDPVTAGQPLAKLDPSDLQVAVKQAAASVLSAEARYDQTVAGATAEDIALARNAVDSGQLTYDQTKRTTQSEIATAQQTLDNAKRALDDAIKTTDRDLVAAHLAVDNAKRSLDDMQKQTQNDSTAAQLTVDNAKKALDQAKVNAQTDTATAQQAFTKVKTSYTNAKSSFRSLVAAIKTDTASFSDGINAARGQIVTAQNDLPSSGADATNARNSLYQADSALANAQTYWVALSAALTNFSSAADSVVAALAGFDAAVSTSTDTAAVVTQYQTATTAYSTAATRLTNGFDAPSGQISTAQTAVLAAQSSANSSTSRGDARFDLARADITTILATLSSDQQLASSIKGEIAQVATNVTSMTDAVTGSYVSAQQAVASAQTKGDASVQSAQNAYTSALQSQIAGQQKDGTSLATVQSAYTSAQQSLTATQQKNTTTLTTAQNAVTSAQQALTTAQDKGTFSVASQEIALKNAQVNLQKSTASPKAADIASALSSLQLAQISLDKARTDLDSATLRSPATGVIASVANQVGEAPANPFAVVAVTATVALHGTVGEADVAKLRLGQVATITVDAVGAASRMTGRVTALDPVATIQQGVPVYGVDVQIDIPDRAIRPGMSGTAAVIVASKQAVLAVPNLAVRSQGGRRFVQVLRDGTPQDAEVEFGISNESVTEVVSGLEEGEQVLLPAPRASATQRPGGGGQGGPFPGGGGQGGGIRAPGVGR